MKAADVMTRKLVTLTPGNSIRHAAALMLEHRVSGLPVVDDTGQLAGMLTEGDLLRRVELGVRPRRGAAWDAVASSAGAKRDFVRSHSWTVADVMTSPVVTITGDTPLIEVAELLATRGIKRLPVVQDGQLVGLVSRADLLRIVAEDAPRPIPRGDIAIRTSVEARLRDATDLVGTGLLVTVEDGVVHVWGTVGSRAACDAVRVIVEGVPGITAFADHLETAPQPGAT